MTYNNYMENLVEQMLDDMISKNNITICCDKCKKDIMSAALNNLPPMYYSTKEAFHKIQSMDTQLRATITTELVKAIKLVEKNPRHE